MSTIYEAMPALAGDIKAVGKSHKNTHQNYKYKSIDDFMQVLNPVLAKHGVTLVPQFRKHRLEPLAKGVRATCVLNMDWVATDGTKITTRHLGEGVDFGDKATNKAMAAAMKYAILQTLCVPTAERKDSEADDSINPSAAKDLEVDWAAKFRKCRSMKTLDEAAEKAADFFEDNNIGPEDERRQAALAEYQRKKDTLS